MRTSEKDPSYTQLANNSFNHESLLTTLTLLRGRTDAVMLPSKEQHGSFPSYVCFWESWVTVSNANITSTAFTHLSQTLVYRKAGWEPLMETYWLSPSFPRNSRDVEAQLFYIQTLHGCQGRDQIFYYCRSARPVVRTLQKMEEALLSGL